VKSIWSKDADNITFKDVDIDKLIFKNSSVSEFLDYKNKLCVIATKGYGKTLLLKYKRHTLLITKKGYNFIPVNNDIDTLSLSANLTQEKYNLLESKENWKVIWKFTFMLSAIMNYGIRSDDADMIKSMQDELIDNKYNLYDYGQVGKNIDTVILKLNKSESIKSFVVNSFNPSQIINSILINSENEIRRVIGGALDILKKYYMAIDYNLCIFIDRIDQEVGNFNNEIWRSSQLGMLEAMYSLNRNNQHVKIYGSIRQEAYAYYGSEYYLQYQDIVTELKYTKDEIKSLFEKAIITYESVENLKSPEKLKENPIAAFLGQEKIFNDYSCCNEDIFDYVYRHSMGRPRDIIYFGEEFHRLGGNLTENTLRLKVNDISSTAIEKGYLREVSRFLSALNETNIPILLKLINKNILSYKELRNICREFNEESSCRKDTCEYCPSNMHVFCDLYNIGLLGTVKDDFTRGGRRFQKFIKPYESPALTLDNNHLDKNSVYLIHTGFQEYIQRVNKYYVVIKGIVVGDDIEWNSRSTLMLDLHTIKESILTANAFDVHSKEQISKAFKYIWEELNNVNAADDVKRNSVLHTLTDIRNNLSPVEDIEAVASISRLIASATNILSTDIMLTS